MTMGPLVQTVRGLSRGFVLLKLLNKFDGGATPGLAMEFSGPHPPPCAGCRTLQEEGFVRRSRSDDSFRLTINVRQLSDGFRDEHWISALATPLLGELLRSVQWPTDITLGIDRRHGGARGHPPLQPTVVSSRDGRTAAPLLAHRLRADVAGALPPTRNADAIIGMLARPSGS